MKTCYGKPGQLFCGICGRLMEPKEGDRPGAVGLVETFCPITEHNTGSWWSVKKEGGFSLPVHRVQGGADVIHLESFAPKPWE